ncbi:patatin-like phospholipase family protein [Gracilimonas mengyeensis]|uniref:NTE family protein n=1 Tax=Gracilimonas mengyeensis TaxID=1302730 RepID=A0A521DWR6_9BACT|nr:patatin-like phospholipase family protein [Gracilimonas mengyeensis]SMO75531.1 NTE family protein [Gracilimonas mengyeensis]
MSSTKQKVHLVLGSGGARGLAHIGVIEKLEEEGYEIVEVIGCSMGAVVGGIYCAGHLKEYKEWLLGLNRSAVFDLMDFTLTSHGFLKGEKIFSRILEMTGEQNIEDFDLPFTAVATDLQNMEEVHYTSGNLFKALRASISIPGIFVPIYENNDILVDGGVLNPLPLDLVKKEDPDALVVAVNVNGITLPVLTRDNAKPEDKGSESWLEKAFHLSGIGSSQKQARLSLFELMDTSYNYTQDRLTQMIINLHQPDLVVEIPRNSAATFDFHRTSELVELGRKQFELAYEQQLTAHQSH